MNEYYRFIKDRPDLKPRYSRELRAEEDPLRRTGIEIRPLREVQ